MKKIFLSIVAILVIIGVVGCKSKVTKEYGESFEVSLYKNSSARIDWKYELSKEGIVDVSYVYDNSSCDPKASGCGGTLKYTIKALKPGEVKLTFKCATKGMCEPKNDIVYKIIVKDDLSIVETHNIDDEE